jgi:hypothetical protein
MKQPELGRKISDLRKARDIPRRSWWTGVI